MARRGQDASIETKRGSSEREAYWRQALADWSRSGLAEGAVDGAAVPLRADGGVEGAVEVVLMNGRRVRVGSGFDGELLAQVVRVLEGMPW